MMSEEKFQELMNAIKASKHDLQKEFTDQITKLKSDVTAGQESSSQEVVKKLNKRTYQFKKKGNEAQYVFNTSVEEHIDAATKELGKLDPTEERDKAIVKKTGDILKEGMKAIEVRQKHIKIADRSELGWAVVAAYEEDELASDSDDEKRIYRAEREAERVAKRKRPGGANAARKKAAVGDAVPPQASARGQNSQGSRLPAARPRLVGPCYRCAEWGHLVANCPKPKQMYPFTQPLVRKARESMCDSNNVCVDSSTSHVVCVNTTEQQYPLEAKSACLSPEGVNNTKGIAAPSKAAEQEGITDCEEIDIQKVAKASDPELLEFDTDLEGSGELLGAQCWEVQEEKSGSQIVDVQGRLRQNLNFWQHTLQAPNNVLEWIEIGYKLPLRYLPDPFSQSNHKSTQVHKSFVTEAVTELIANRCVRQVTEKPYICSSLSVVENAEGKLRLVLNLRYLNQFLSQVKFKYEDLRVALLLFTKDDFLFKFDLKSGYHHLDIFKPHQKYLGFAWDTDGQQQFYVFTVLPFGLSTACYVFTKLMRPLIRYWRGRGLRAVLYLDDGIVAVKGKERAIQESEKVQSELVEAGLIANNTKSQWVPTKSLIWLGFQINLQDGQLTLPVHKVESLARLMLQAKDSRSIQATTLPRITGKIISMGLALGPVTRLMTRSLYTVLNARRSWCQHLLLTANAVEELSFWLKHIDKFNGQNIWPKASAVRVVYSDASGTGFGGYCVEHGDKVVTGQWSEEEAIQSSTWRELKAVRLVLDTICQKLENHRVRWFTDNQNVPRIVLYGSRKPILQEEALAIFTTCVNHHIRLEPEWVPREANEFADYISKLVDYDDWMLNPRVFRELDIRWGPHTIDRFADGRNHQLERFNSRYWFPGTEAVDTFTCNWGNENNWWCPPLHLVPRLLKHAEVTKAEGTLVVPQWVSAPFWPLLFPDSKQVATFVKEVVELPQQKDLFLPGQMGLNIFNGIPNTAVLALRLSFVNAAVATTIK